VKNIKKIHRVVVKPDYQGIGLGYSLLCHISKKYKSDGVRVRNVTSNPALIFTMIKRKEWVMTRKPSRLQNTTKTGVLEGTTSVARLTASFEFVG